LRAMVGVLWLAHKPSNGTRIIESDGDGYS
jgi:hypothetical protein